MDREPPPVTVTAPGADGAPPDVLEAAPRRPTRRPTVVLALLGVAVLGAAAVRGGQGTPPGPAPSPTAPTAPTATRPDRTLTAGVTATASLGGAPTDEAYAQRLVLTVDLPPFDARNNPSGLPLGDEVRLLGVRLRGFTVEPVDGRSSVPLGRFGRARSARSTTLPLTAAVDDCSIEPQARRDIVLTVQTGDGPEGSVQAVADPDVVRALDRLVSRTCRRPRG